MNPRTISPTNQTINQEGQENGEIKRQPSKSPDPSNREHSRSREGVLFTELQVNVGLATNVGEVIRVQVHEEAEGPQRKSLRLEKKKAVGKKIKKKSGHWAVEEQLKFIRGIAKEFPVRVQDHGKKWEAVKKYIPTRSTTQIRAHAQKFMGKIRLIKPSNMDEVEYIKSCRPEELVNLKVSRKRNAPKEVIVQTDFDLPVEVYNTPKQSEVVLQTRISNRDLNEVFLPRKRKRPCQALSSHRKEEKQGQAHAEFVQQECNAPETSVRVKEFNAQTTVSFAAKVERATQTDFAVYVPMLSAVITKCLTKMMERIQELPLRYDIDSNGEPEKAKKLEFLVKSSERLRDITFNAVMTQQQSIRENGLSPTNLFIEH
jgi:hypothetical protein